MGHCYLMGSWLVSHTGKHIVCYHLPGTDGDLNEKTCCIFVYHNKEATYFFSTYLYTTGCLFDTDVREPMIIRNKSDFRLSSIASARFCKKEKKT